MENYHFVIETFERKLDVLAEQNLDFYIRTQETAAICNEALVAFQDIVLSKSFKSDKHEIEFFKSIKPVVVSKLIFCIEYFNIRYKFPNGLRKFQIRYLNEQIQRLQEYFDNNREFYHYHLKKETNLDEHYFLRKNKKARLNVESYHFFTDSKFSTSHDITKATILAHEDLIKKLHLDIDSLLESNRFSDTTTQPIQKFNRLNWTGNKTDLIELIYALYSSGVINNSNTEIKTIATALQEVLNVDLGNYYHSFVEMRTRKINQTKFLDKLKESLINYIQTLDALN